MRTSWRTELPLVVLILAMFLVGALMWNSAPKRIPMHWNSVGQVNDYGGKFEGLFLLPLAALGTYLLTLFLPRADPLRDNYARFANVYTIVRYAILVSLAAIYGLSILWVRGVELDIGTFVAVPVGALLLVLGNYMGKIQPNWFVGIKTPWTLTSRRSWTKTHRLGGWLFVFMGVVMIVSAFSNSAEVLALIGPFVIGVVVLLFAYSYLVWRGDPDRSERSPQNR